MIQQMERLRKKLNKFNQKFEFVNIWFATKV